MRTLRPIVCHEVGIASVPRREVHPFQCTIRQTLPPSICRPRLWVAPRMLSSRAAAQEGRAVPHMMLPERLLPFSAPPGIVVVLSAWKQRSNHWYRERRKCASRSQQSRRAVQEQTTAHTCLSQTFSSFCVSSFPSFAAAAAASPCFLQQYRLPPRVTSPA